MKIQDLPLPTVQRLHEKVLLPAANLASQLETVRKLAFSTHDLIHAETLLQNHKERFLISIVKKEILPIYQTLLNIYQQHQSDFIVLIRHDTTALETELKTALNEPRANFFHGDSPVIASFLSDVTKVSHQLSARFRELSYG